MSTAPSSSHADLSALNGVVVARATVFASGATTASLTPEGARALAGQGPFYGQYLLYPAHVFPDPADDSQAIATVLTKKGVTPARIEDGFVLVVEQNGGMVPGEHDLFAKQYWGPAARPSFRARQSSKSP